MSALRVSIPGKPTVLVDLGPDYGRASHARGSVHGGALVTAMPKPKPPSEVKRAYERAAYAARRAPRETKPCGRWIIRRRAECARTKGHNGSCTTAERLAKLAEARRAGR